MGQTIIKPRYTMKPTLFAAIVLISFAMALLAPAPILPIVVASGTTSVVAPTLVLSGGSALPLAVLGAKKLLLAGALLLPSHKALLRLEEFSVYQTKTIEITESSPEFCFL